ncbi:MAG TPA: hypothetical protein VI431_02280 [Candidatus Acidoferrum sp.]
MAPVRIDANNSDFPAATKEIRHAITCAHNANKPFLEPLLKRLEAKDDININK